MKLYHHYKNKNYKYINEAKHSETLEDFVFYETLHENEFGKFWIRPKKMFHEEIEYEGVKRPRFKEVMIHYENRKLNNKKELNPFLPLIHSILTPKEDSWYEERFHRFSPFYLTVAFIENQPIGFKLGYEEKKSIFYSWLGGVLTEFRGFGIAQKLMTTQHEWCRERGYAKIRTKTLVDYRAMLCLNIKNGFNMMERYTSKDGKTKYFLEKSLNDI